MTDQADVPSNRRLRVEAAAAILICAARLFTQPLSGLWRDWLLILGLTWLATVLAPRRNAVALLLPAVAAYLLGIYLVGHWPYLSDFFRGRV